MMPRFPAPAPNHPMMMQGMYPGGMWCVARVVVVLAVQCSEYVRAAVELTIPPRAAGRRTFGTRHAAHGRAAARDGGTSATRYGASADERMNILFGAAAQ